MDDSLLELENELKRLRPCAPSAKLLANIESGLAASFRDPAEPRTLPATEASRFPWFTWPRIAAAAAVLALLTVGYTVRRPGMINPDRAEPKPVAENALTAPTPELAGKSTVILTIGDNNRYRPVGAASVLYDLREEGPATRATNTPVRRLRYRYVDTYTWRNPATNASLKWSVPRDEVRVLPASLH